MDPAGQLQAPQISWLGTHALLFEAPGALSLVNQQRIWALADYSARLNSIRGVVPGMNNLMLVFDPQWCGAALLPEQLLRQWERGESKTFSGRIIELNVIYGGEQGPHICDVAEHTGMTIQEIVQRHSEPLYPVYALGSHPGYCYLGNMDPQIATPRRSTPVQSIPGGSVSIGGVQTGVSASAGPSGWNTIGRTDFIFFDAHAEPPVRLQPGDSIRFRVEKVLA